MKKFITRGIYTICIVLLLVASMNVRGQDTLHYGDNVQGNVAVGGIRSYRLLGSVNEIITILSAKSGGSLFFAPRIRVYSPVGTLLKDVSGSPSSPWLRLDTFTLLQTGTYSILVSDDNGLDGGSYGLSLQKLNPGIGPLIKYDSSLAGSISNAAFLNAYLFDGCSNDIITFQVAKPTGNLFFAPGIEVYSPKGTLVARAYSNPNLPSISLDALRLPDSGRYTILVLDDNGQEPGDYGLSLVSIILNNCAMPVTWLYFKGQQQQKDVLLTWATATEQNSREFKVERSFNGREYIEIGAVPAAGNSSIISNYEYSDKGVSSFSAPVIYYRLRQVDLDGKFEYSVVVTVSPLQVTIEPTIKAVPNPFKNTIALQMSNLPATGKSDKVEIYSMEGKLLYQRKITNRGNATIYLNDLPVLLPGTYLLKAMVNGKPFTINIMRE